MLDSRKVFITGIGIISPCGENSTQTWKSLIEGRVISEPIPSHWNDYTELKSRIWAPLPDIDYSNKNISRADKLQLDKMQLLSIIAAQEALESAQLPFFPDKQKKNCFTIPELPQDRTGVFMGTGSGGITSVISAQANHTFTPVEKRLNFLDSTVKNQIDSLKLGQIMRTPARYNPFVVSMMMPNACSSALGIRFGLTGTNETCCLACASGTVAIGKAYRAIANGELDCALCGGAEYLGDEYGGVFRSFDSADTLVKGEFPSSPFDKNRSGFLFAEGGAAVLILESYEHAAARRAPILGALRGFESCFDPYSCMSMEPGGKGIEEMLRALLKAAELIPSDIDYINSHGTATEMNDEIEASVIHRVFGNNTPVNSTKALMGHSLGACGAIETAVTVLSLFHGRIHGMPLLDDPIENIMIFKQSQPLQGRFALTQSFAFGGHNAALLLEKV